MTPDYYDTENKLKLARASWSNTDDDQKINTVQKYCGAAEKPKYAKGYFGTNKDFDETLNDFA